jgi:hypothetical protein
MWNARQNTSVVHDDDPTRLNDGLHHRDGPDGVGDTTTSIADHGWIYSTALEWLYPKMASTSILMISSNPKILSQGTLGSAHEITIPPSPEARVFGAMSRICGEG